MNRIVKSSFLGKVEFLGIVMILTIVLSGCFSDGKEEIPDVSDVTIDLEMVRFDKELFQLDTNNLEVEIDVLKNEFPEFSSLFFTKILPFEGETKEEFIINLKGYLTAPKIKELQETVLMEFPSTESIELKDLMKAMQYMKYYFPDFEVPRLYAFTSEFTYQRFIFPDENGDGIGIGLDMFLGDNYDYKSIDPNNPAFSQYLTRTFSKEYIPKKVMELLIDDQLGKVPGSRLLDHMIHNGKKLYLIEKVLPMASDSIVLEYTSDQTKWVKENELGMWAFFFDQNLFYESNAMKINKYIHPSPTSPGMPEGAPGRTANYIGLQIVKAYMKKFPETSFNELIQLKDSQMIMDKSRYKPKQR